MKKVIIGIKSTQGIGEEKEVIELTTDGTLKIADDRLTLNYDESKILGVKNTKTSLTVIGNSTVITERTGDIASKLIIKIGTRNNCFYSTPHGDLMIGIFGESIENCLGKDGGTLKMAYAIDSNLQPISKNTVEITVKPADNRKVEN